MLFSTHLLIGLPVSSIELYFTTVATLLPVIFKNMG